jgi:hypothetical protein
VRTALEHGFSLSVVQAPIVIADGVKGNAAVEVPIEGKIFDTVSIAHEIYYADSLLVATHFKGHELSGFGGAIKNLAMGCASRKGKLRQHSTVGPWIDTRTCVGCGTCADWCPADAIEMEECARILAERCIGCGECYTVCAHGAVCIAWDEVAPDFQRKMVEYAMGAVQNKADRVAFVNFLLQVSPSCDCCGYSDAPIVGDIGILASDDPVAIDQASVDLVNAQAGSPHSVLTAGSAPGDDKFRSVHRGVDWRVQLVYGEELGLGQRQYELNPV